jgi:cytidylate kinase
MLITVSGPAGSGKSTFAAALANALEVTHVSGGDIFREMADERDMSLVAFNELAEEDEQVDRDLDRRLREIAKENTELVLESRLAGWMAGEHADLRLWLDAPMNVRARRIADREDKTVEQARAETTARAESEARRYEEYYGVDIEDRMIYDLVLNTSRWTPPAELEIVLAAINSYDPEDDEGKAPLTGVDYDF